MIDACLTEPKDMYDPGWICRYGMTCATNIIRASEITLLITLTYSVYIPNGAIIGEVTLNVTAIAKITITKAYCIPN